MNRKHDMGKILEAWMMVERLSSTTVPERCLSFKLELNSSEEREENSSSVFDILLQAVEAQTKQKKQHDPEKQPGIVLYAKVFEYEELLKHLCSSDEEKPVEPACFGGKLYTFSLAFPIEEIIKLADAQNSSELTLSEDSIFFTEGGYIYKEKAPLNEENFKNYKAEHSEWILETFKGVSCKEGFNKAISKLMRIYGFSTGDLLFKKFEDIKDSKKFNSFYLQDLGMAKQILTENGSELLSLYLGRNRTREERVNLDTKECIKAGDMKPAEAFEKILAPVAYPRGRFPSKTEYPLAFMQQVAVNLARGFDKQPMRSVNGPPGTGKTTLLKDVFAELVVQQAHFIVSDLKVKDLNSIEFSTGKKITCLPDELTEKGILVASSNNAAVQNIVKELPLIDGIDKNLLKELQEVDYFYDIANEKESKESALHETDNRTQSSEEVSEKDQYWGLFSLEGGKSDNMSNLKTKLNQVYESLKNCKEDNKKAYESFQKQYERVEALVKEAQEVSDAHKKKKELAHKIKDKGTEEDALKKEQETIDNCIQKIQLNESVLSQQLEELQALKFGIFEFKNRSNRKKQCKQINQEKLELMSKRQRKEQIKFELASRRSDIETEVHSLREEENKCIDTINKWQEKEQVGNECLFDMTCYREKLKKSESAYEWLQKSNPWFGQRYREEQSRLFIHALAVRKQFLYENREELKKALEIWEKQDAYERQKEIVQVAWGWINLAIPVISSTFASIRSMCRNLGVNSMGQLFIDEAGQALPWASVGAIFRSRAVMVVGDPFQIRPVLTLDEAVLTYLRDQCFKIRSEYLSETASTQTLVDACSQYGFYTKAPSTTTEIESNTQTDSWIGIPLWVHRRCKDPMFSISNAISYNGMMVHGSNSPQERTGQGQWIDIKGKASDKYVQEQGEWLKEHLEELAKKRPEILDHKKKDIVYIISPFRNVAQKLAGVLDSIGFTRKPEGKPTNVGTIHTFQGKEAPIVFLVLGADENSEGSARWAVKEANMMNVAATRAKEEFYIIGDYDLYKNLNSPVINETLKYMKVQHQAN